MRHLLGRSRSATMTMVAFFSISACERDAAKAPAGTEAAPAALAAKAKKPLRKIRIIHWRATCEAPTFVAKDMGFFKEEGIDAELAPANIEAVLNAEGKLVDTTGQAVHAAMVFPLHIVQLLQGAPLNYMVTAGLHQGCFQTVALPGGKRTEDPKTWRGAKIGVPLQGTKVGGKFVRFLSTEEFYLRTVAKNAGLDPDKDIKFVDFRIDLAGTPKLLASSLIGKLKGGELDMVSAWDPLSQTMIDKAGMTHVASNTHTPPFSRVFCCFLGIDRDIVEKDLELAKAITRAYLKASRWVAKEPRRTAELIHDGGYTGFGGDREKFVNSVAKSLSIYIYAPNPDIGTDMQKMLKWATALGLVKLDGKLAKERIDRISKNVLL